MSIQVSPEAGSVPRSRTLNISLWVAQVLLGITFGMVGVMKLTMPLALLAKNMPFVNDMPGALVRFIGAVELAGAIGVLLPALIRVRPGLTSPAAAGLLTMMVLASGFHVLRGEFSAIRITIVLGGLAAFVAWGRFRRAPIVPKKAGGRDSLPAVLSTGPAADIRHAPVVR